MKKLCCNCGACANICSFSAIKVNYNDSEDFVPKKSDNCRHCGLCDNVCPLINSGDRNNIKMALAYISNEKEVLKSASSGGFVSDVCLSILKNNGIVYAATYYDNEIRHVRIDCIEELIYTRGSKYSTSNLINIYVPLMEDLRKNEKVLFIGTPCQVMALKNYLKIKKIACDNLVTIDLICHGVTDQKLFKEYTSLLEKKYDSKIKYISFRKKINRKSRNIYVEFQNGKIYKNSSDLDFYYYLYLNGMIFKECCIQCKFNNLERVGDLSVGDLWGDPIITDKVIFDGEKGCNLVLINSDKGLNIIHQLNGIYTKVILKKYINSSLSGKSKKINDNSFKKDYYNMGFDYIYKNKSKYMKLGLKQHIKKILHIFNIF